MGSLAAPRATAGTPEPSEYAHAGDDRHIDETGSHAHPPPPRAPTPLARRPSPLSIFALDASPVRVPATAGAGRRRPGPRMEQFMQRTLDAITIRSPTIRLDNHETALTPPTTGPSARSPPHRHRRRDHDSNSQPTNPRGQHHVTKSQTNPFPGLILTVPPNGTLETQRP